MFSTSFSLFLIVYLYKIKFQVYKDWFIQLELHIKIKINLNDAQQMGGLITMIFISYSIKWMFVRQNQRQRYRRLKHTIVYKFFF